MSDLKSTNSFVTGGSRGIGRAIVLRFAEAGYRCIFTYHSNEKEAQKTVTLAQEKYPQAQVSYLRLRLENSSEIEEVCTQVSQIFEDKVDVIVNNAALIRANYAALMSNEEWEQVMQVCLTAPFYVIRGFLMNMIAQRYGRIINISSLAQEGSSGQCNYAAAKGGLCSLTKTIAKEYGSKGVTCNAVTPGVLKTDMTTAHLPEEVHKDMLKFCPLRRSCSEEELSAVVHFLSQETASYVNGAVIPVTGGLSDTV